MIATFRLKALYVNDTVLKTLNTPADFVRWGATRFNEAGLHFGHGTDNAIDEALYLVSSALSLEPVIAPELMLAKLLPEEKKRILGLFDRRIAERKPAAYLLNKAWFMGLPFYVDQRVLVPRSPLAELIEYRFQPWLGDRDVGHVLDLCTGSACIAIACANVFPEARVSGSDISADALQVARMNVEQHGLDGRVELIESDIYSALAARRYDLIVSNPPYVATGELGDLPDEYRAEPELGLVAGRDGLDVVRRILAGAAMHLNPDGLLVVEVGLRAQDIEQAFPDLPFLWPEFERGGEGVFALKGSDLSVLAPAVAAGG